MTFQGDVVLKPLDAAPQILHREEPDSLVFHPQGRSVDLDVALSRFVGDEMARDVPIERLDLFRIEEQHSAGYSSVREEPTVLAGVAQFAATGERHRLKKGDSLRCAAIAGSLSDLRLGEDGIHLVFQGSVAKLTRTAAGLRRENLMPSILDLRVTGPARRIVPAASGFLAVVTLALAVLSPRPHEKEIA